MAAVVVVADRIRVGTMFEQTLHEIASSQAIGNDARIVLATRGEESGDDILHD
jgi:hypothetical protein